MASFFDNLGLRILIDTDDDMSKMVRRIMDDGVIIPAYGYGYYVNLSLGDVQLIARCIINHENENIEIVGIDTHCKGECTWRIRVSSIGEITSNDSDMLKRVVALSNNNAAGELIVSHIVNANALPSYLPDDEISLQMVAFAKSLHYYSDEDAYAEAQETALDGKKWLLSEASIIPSGFLQNHDPMRDKSEMDFSTDDIVALSGTVTDLKHGVTEIDGREKNCFIRCFIDTLYGSLEILHTLHQIDEKERINIRIGAVVTGFCVLSGNVAISKYENGAIFDEEHNLRLLRSVFVSGDIKHAEYAFDVNATLFFRLSSFLREGRDEIIRYLHNMCTKTHGGYNAQLATIISNDENPSPEYEIDRRCLLLAKGDNEFDSIFFIDTNEKGKIKTIALDAAGRYQFTLDKVLKNSSISGDDCKDDDDNYSDDNKIIEAFNRLSNDQVERFLPRGVEQAKSVITSFIVILGRGVSYDILLEMYLRIMSRIMLAFAPYRIVYTLNIHYPNLINKSNVYRVIGFSYLSYRNNAFCLSNQADMETLSREVDSLEETEHYAETNRGRIDIGAYRDDYGYTESNPIYANWVTGSHRYLDSLRTPDGGRISWKRLGSTSGSNIYGPIDIYEIYTGDHSHSTVYINMYSYETSSAAPKGFYIEKN